MKTCPKCQKEHEANGRFCSRSCANSRGPRTEEFKEKVRAKLSGRKQPTDVTEKIQKSRAKTYLLKKKTCSVCDTIILKKDRKTCSKECRSILTSINSSKQLRRGGGKKGWYKGFHCDSTYELAYVIWHLDHNVHIERCTEYREYTYKGKVQRYTPDFIVDGNIIEIKGFLSERASAKLEQHSDVILVDKVAIIPYIKYVKDHYKVYNIEDLYEDAPTHHCAFCDHTFQTFRKNAKFCSQRCAGLFQAKRKQEEKKATDINTNGCFVGFEP